MTGRIRRFLSASDLTGAPKFLPFHNAGPEFRPRYCLNNCESAQRLWGWGIVYGWMVWEDAAQHFIEAEFHSVANKNGVLLDITPRVDSEPRILFVPDSTRTPIHLDYRTWRTWSNFKSLNGELRVLAEEIELQEPEISTYSG